MATPGDGSNVIPFPGARRDHPSAEGPRPRASHGSAAPDADDRSRVVTLLLAELRAWNEVSERLGADQARDALSRAIDGALASLRDAGALELTLEGATTQPTLSATFEGQDGPSLALQAAVTLRRAVAGAQNPEPPEHQFRVGTGIDAGPIVDAFTPDDVRFEAVGTLRMCAARLRDFAGPGQVFFSDTVFEAAQGTAVAQPLGGIRINQHGETREAYSLSDLRSG